MASSGDAPRQHAASTGGPAALPEPGHGERVRTLLAGAGVGVLSTQSLKQAGFPFGSLMPFALDEAGRPVLLISNMAMHTQNLKAEARASLFVGEGAQEGEALGAARATLLGRALPMAGEELAGVRELYLARQPNSRYWVDFADFGFFRLEVVDVYYVGGFGVMGWVAAEEYGRAEVDPLAGVAAGILEHMNADHEEAMRLLARVDAGIEASEAAMISVDRLGFRLRLKAAEGMKGVRLNFPAEVRDAAQARAALVEMVRRARG